MRTPLSGRDLVTVGIFTVILAVINVLCNAIGVFGPEVQPFGAVTAVIINGIPFALFIRRVQGFGLVTITATLLSLISGLLGDAFVGVPIAFLLGLLADLIIRSGGYRDARRTILGYGIFGIYPIGSLLPLLFMRDDIVARYAEHSDPEWAQRFSDFLSTPMIVAMIVILFVAALIGGWIGQRVLRSYFSRAGL
ncbi:MULTISPECIES: MptD family putative ECF transporter S component [unclassified Corynebacterium]|uniref:MptD family putative ECF transporter S component n=1 Tax=unclassified Corynebacterium TaxID=2624378 RepID=UPI0029CA2C69|nr:MULTISPECIES: MptD family putative ECF transporter S component [unclassified Corynebacterium]WPF66754.1 MptD family putative ECF transporter S component [Corynebacterium sp. 22KM0430]WPF69242.1 MptD family putative ECF transporter S component [Corynebacterium sp. 21KM1197]